MDVITEPATLLTDYLLAIFTAVLAVRLHAPGRRGRNWWALGFAASAVAGAAGGTVHGFKNVLPPATIASLWMLTLEAIVFAGLAVVIAVLASAGFSDRTRRMFTAFACLGYGGYALWIPNHPQFVFALIGYGFALLFLTLVQASKWMSVRSRESGWLLAGVGISVVAAVVQQSGWALHRHFNHNDLFHVIQAVAVWLLYRGASLNSQLPSPTSQTV